jgi:hypothetical protein
MHLSKRERLRWLITAYQLLPRTRKAGILLGDESGFRLIWLHAPGWLLRDVDKQVVSRLGLRHALGGTLLRWGTPFSFFSLIFASKGQASSNAGIGTSGIGLWRKSCLHQSNALNTLSTLFVARPIRA